MMNVGEDSRWTEECDISFPPFYHSMGLPLNILTELKGAKQI